MIIAACAVLVLAGSVWVLVGAVRGASALGAVSAAVQEQRAALAAFDAAAEALDRHRDEARQALALAADIQVLAPTVATPEATTAFSAAVKVLATGLAGAGAAVSPPTPTEISNFSAPALEEAADELRKQATWYRDTTDSMDARSALLGDGRGDLVLAAAALYASVAVVEPSLEAASWVAPIAPKLAVRSALADVEGARFDRAGVAALQEYSEAVIAMQEAHVAELATFAGPFYDNKVAALSFANSIAGGVLLEFEWVPELYGFGSGFGMGANATLEGERDGVFSSRITITENAAARWGDGGPEAIIAHEVGHAVTNKCWDLFEEVAGGDYEAFATAWAIGMGYTNPSNGTTAYGRPSDELIEATKACR